jgi:alpha-tubulin suppressor-like RCC1 family protein
MLHPLKEVTEVACGLYHSCAVTASGSLYTWGENSHYACGRGGSAPSLSPEFLLGGVKKVACGAYHSFATLEDGRVVVWGGSTEVGNHGVTPETPRPMSILDEGRGVACIAAGYNFSAVMDGEGKLYTLAGNSGKIGSTENNRVVSGVWKVPRKYWEDIAWQSLRWLFLGKMDSGSVFRDFPVEILYNMVVILFRNN